MAQKLFRLLFTAVGHRANNRAHPTMWLPRILQGLPGEGEKGKLLPVRGSDWKVGQIKQDNGYALQVIFAKAWWVSVRELVKDKSKIKGFEVIHHPDEDKKWPVLTATTAIVTGLDNVYLDEKPSIREDGSDYLCDVILRFGHYKTKDGVSADAVTVGGDYSFTINLGVSDVRTPKEKEEDKKHKRPRKLTTKPAPHPDLKATWPVKPIRATGAFRFHFNELKATVRTRVGVTGSGTDRKLTTTVESVKVTAGSTPVTVDTKAFTMKTTDLKGDANTEELRREMALKLFTARETAEFVMSTIGETLSSADTRKRLSKSIGEQLAKGLDQSVGKGAPASPSGSSGTPVDAYLFDRIRTAVGDRKSPLYAPSVVLSLVKPALDPYTTDEMRLPDLKLKFSGVEMELTEFRLKKVEKSGPKAVGLSNAVIPVSTFTDKNDLVSTRVRLASVAEPGDAVARRPGGDVTVPVSKPPLRFESDFETKNENTQLKGRITVDIADCALDSVMKPSGSALEDLTLTFTKLALNEPSKMHIKLDVDSEFRKEINEAINTRAIYLEVIKGIQGELDKRLKEISEAVTADVRKMLKARMGDPT
ncbi:hypothetical protein [Streptomyces sp. NPDC001678]|uniref:hypothetical protein n=1 Tax=Streptomyces sp. NPDC001678 TaxID=3364599 RepID=UPI0036D067DE